MVKYKCSIFKKRGLSFRLLENKVGRFEFLSMYQTVVLLVTGQFKYFCLESSDLYGRRHVGLFCLVVNASVL